MLVIWGKKTVRARQGVIGRFCPMCRTVRLHDVTKISEVSHIYFVPLDSGTVQAIEGECRGCRSVYADEDAAHWMPLRDPDVQALAPDATVEELCELAVASRGEDPEELLAQLELEDKLRAGSLTAEERFALVVEPIAATAYMTVVKSERSGQQSVTTVLAGLLIAGLIATALLWGTLYQQRTPRTGMDYAVCISVSVVTALLAVVVVKRVLRATKMGVRTYVLGPLSRSLAAISPRVRVEELEAALELMRQHEHPLAKVVGAAELAEGIEKVRGERR